MTTTPYALTQMSIDGGALVTGARTLSGSNTVQLSGVSTVGWTSQLWEIYEYPEGFACPSGWTNSNGIYQSNAVVPPIINIPSSTPLWGKYFWRLTVNNGLLNGVYMDPYSTQPHVDETACVQVLSPIFHFPDVGYQEKNQFNVTRQWVGELKKMLRLLDAGAGAGFTNPTGTGFVTSTGGVLNGATLAFPLTYPYGGTGLTVLGTGLQALRTNAGATAMEWYTPAAGASIPTGTGFYHTSAGAMDAAAVSLTWTGDATGTGTGTSFALTVVKVNGASVPASGALVTGNGLYASGVASLSYSALNLGGGSGWVTGVLPSANQAAQTLAGDVTGPTSTSVVIKVNGSSVPAGGALTTGNGLYASGASALTYSALNLGGGSGWVTGTLPIANQSAPTGTGYPHVTGGTYDAAAVSLTWTGDATGSGTGTSFALTVVRINGATVPAAGGALTTGNGLYVSGASGLAYSALNLAGGATWVTGLLPTGNQAAQTMAGDVTGTTTASVVAKINGATVPAAGALTTGNSLHVTASSTLAYAALNLAGGAGFVTGLLPTGNQAAQSLAGDASGTTAAVVNDQARGLKSATTTVSVSAATAPVAGQFLGATASTTAIWQKVDLTNSICVFVPGSGGSIVTSTSGSLTSPSDVLAGTTFISIGTTPATVGKLRFPYAATDTIIGVKDSGGTDRDYISRTAANTFKIGAGSTTFTTLIDEGILQLWGHTNFQIFSGSGQVATLSANGTTMKGGLPLIGDSGVSSQYGKDGVASAVAMGSANYTVAPQEYIYDMMIFGNTLDGLKIFLPTPVSEAASYTKEISFTGTGVSLGLWRADGAGATTNISSGKKKRVRVRPGGVYECSAEVAGP